jgi:dienelactone hydrolase
MTDEGDDPRRKSVVLTVSGMDQVELRRDLEYRSVGDHRLQADVYLPAGLREDDRVPAVIFVHGDGPPDVLRGAKDWGQYTSWGRLAAACGLIGITFDHRSSEQRTKLADAAFDVVELVSFVRRGGARGHVDVDRLGVWVASAGPPTVLPWILRDRPPFIRCVAVLYGVMDTAAEALAKAELPIAPMLVARAGLDSEAINDSIDTFVAAALARNVELDLLTHPTGRHAFDILDDDERSCEIVAMTLAFFRRHLLAGRGAVPSDAGP